MEEIQVIELKMMDKRKYYPLTLVSGLTIRSMLYPFMLIKTRLQIQRSKTVYKGTFDALLKIGKTEGTSGLYRGFWVSLITSVCEIPSYPERFTSFFKTSPRKKLVSPVVFTTLDLWCLHKNVYTESSCK